MSKYIEIDENNVNVINEGVVMLDFYADWCGPCRMIAPVIEELAEDFEGKAKICKVNTEKNQDLAMKFGVRNIPFIAFLKDGEMVDSIVGAHSKKTFAERINNLL